MDRTEAAGRLRRALDAAADGLVDRAVVVELIGLAAVAGEHVLLVGPPGTAKSEVARRVAVALGGRYFEYLLGRFTEPSELFGPVDLRRLQEGVLETVTDGMLPEAEIAFLDEVFLGSTAILNTLLALLNERTFRRGGTVKEVPLRVAVGASNRLPTDPQLDAFADRFLVHAFVDPLPDARLEELLEVGWQGGTAAVAVASLDDLDALSAAARSMDLSPVRDALGTAFRLLRRAGIALSDRRMVRAQRLVAAAAVLADRDAPTPADLWPVVYAVPGQADQGLARDALADLLAPSENPALLAAVEEASRGPAARAARLVRDGEALLASTEEDQGWRLRLEAVAREIDAAWDEAARPEAVEALRGRIVEALS